MKLTINPNFKNLLWPLTPDEKQQLEENIKKDGCRDPLVIWQGTLIDGHNRYEFCEPNNIPFKTISMNFDNESQVIEWIDKNQVGRRNITADQLRVIRGRSYNRMKQDKTNNLTNVSKAQIGPSTNTAENLANVSIGQIGHSTNTAEKLAKEYGVSEHTIRRDAKFALEVDSTPELKKAVANKIPIKQIEKEKKQKQSKEAYNNKVKQAKLNPQVNTFNGPYDLILADPCWRYDFSKDNADKIENHYDTLTVEEIIKHKPNSADNAILLLWATAPKLLEALEVMKAWGFNYITNAIWDKETIGMGYWFRGQHELLLVGTKGKVNCTPECQRISSIFCEKKTKHSKKPECVYKWIEAAFPDKTKLEMYCRNVRLGWSHFGNEV